MVESALVLVTFLVMVIGIADLSVILFIQTSLGERIRNGLRYGVVTYDAAAIRNQMTQRTLNHPGMGVPIRASNSACRLKPARKTIRS